MAISFHALGVATPPVRKPSVTKWTDASGTITSARSCWSATRIPAAHAPAALRLACSSSGRYRPLNLQAHHAASGDSKVSTFPSTSLGVLTLEEEHPGEGVVEGARSCEGSHHLQQTPAAKLEHLQQRNRSASRSRRCPGSEIGVGAGKFGLWGANKPMTSTVSSTVSAKPKSSVQTVTRVVTNTTMNGAEGVNLALESHGKGQVGQVHDLAIHVAAYPQVEDAYVRSDDSSLEIFASKPNMNDHIKEESIGVVGGNFNGKSISFNEQSIGFVGGKFKITKLQKILSWFQSSGVWWCGIWCGRV